MVEVLFFAVGAFFLLGALKARASQQTRATRIQGLFDGHPDWSATPLEGEGGKLEASSRIWSAFGKTAQGVFWEVYLVRQKEHPAQLQYRALSLPLPQLELVITGKEGFAKFQEALPKIESMLNTFLGKMAGKLASNFLSRMGLTLEDLLGFLKTAEAHPAGSPAFQSKYSVLTRGKLPLEKLITPAAEAIVSGWANRDFGLRWGTQGLQFYIQAEERESVELAGQMVELGRLLTGGSV